MTREYAIQLAKYATKPLAQADIRAIGKASLRRSERAVKRLKLGQVAKVLVFIVLTTLGVRI